MRLDRNILQKVAVAGVALCLGAGFFQLQPRAAQQSAPQAGPRGGAGQRGGPGQQAVDPRVQMRTYRFTDTTEDLPDAVFEAQCVRKVSKDKKNPLGSGGSPSPGLGGGRASVCYAGTLSTSRKPGGYILVGPMGYNPQGWFGSPVIAVGGRGGGGGAAAAPANLTELSEKDVMNVLDMIRKEFNVDERRTYLMGHSMGARNLPCWCEVRDDMGGRCIYCAGVICDATLHAGASEGYFAAHSDPWRCGHGGAYSQLTPMG